MKLRKILLGFSTIAIMAISSLMPLTSCSSSKKKPEVKTAEVRNAPVYHIKTDAQGKMYYSPTSLTDSFEVWHFNGSEIGYIDVDYYVQKMMQFETIYGKSMFNFESITKDKKSTIYNPFTKSTCTIDYSKQTITFSDYDAFLVNQTATVNPLATGINGGEKYFVSIESKYKQGNEYAINLSKYNINIFYYNDRMFLPYDLYRNIINVFPLQTLFYNGQGFYEIRNAIDQETCDLYQTVRNKATVFTPEYMQYTYDLLALTLDTKYGMKERPSRANKGTTIKYFENGAYSTLAPYHDKMVSTEDNVSNEAWASFFANEVDDGGHTMYAAGNIGGNNVFATKPLADGANKGKETKVFYDTKDRLTHARKTAGYDIDDFWGAGKENRKCYYAEYEVTGSDKKIAYLTFDSFRSDKYENYTEAEKSAGRELQSQTDNSNYWQDTLRMTMYANKMIKQNNIKNVVLDLSLNGGGVVFTESFLASWLCNGITQKLYNPHTNAYTEYTAKADINGDGIFNSDDYIGDDVNVYMIISGWSFSCANALPCNVADGRPSTVFIGEQTAGGACYTDNNLETGLGNVYRGSSNYHWLRKDSSYGNYISFDTGVSPTSSWSYDSSTDPAKFYDRTYINKKILG